jgi:NAD(P)-dependent dehydrogenase (short-subunit alcohol dehydrogenase family)
MTLYPDGLGVDLRGQHAVVTGAGGGIASACALALARAGADLTLLARSSDKAEGVRREVVALGAQAWVAEADVRDAEQVAAAMSSAARNAPLSILVNVAGLNRTGPTVDQSPDDFRLVIDTNLMGTYHACRAFAAEVLPRKGSAAIVNTSSQMGRVGYPGRAAYCASKHAVDGLTKALAVEWAAVGIRVNAVAPTFIDTPLTRPMFQDAAFREDVLRRIPMGRIGAVDEVVAAVLFLASPAASLITGEILGVDGGWTAW